MLSILKTKFFKLLIFIKKCSCRSKCCAGNECTCGCNGSLDLPEEIEFVEPKITTDDYPVDSSVEK